jgi:nucleotide-binding universal stress UspA family protein
MTAALIVVIVILGLALAAVVILQLVPRLRRRAGEQPARAERILFPFMADALSGPALDAALRLAIAEDATLVPVFLARVPLNLPLETPLPRQAGVCLPLQEAIEQRAREAGVPVDSRIARGRSYRHALRNAIAGERFDRIVVAAATNGSPGFDADDVAWLLSGARGEIVVLRPRQDTQLPEVHPRPRRLAHTLH